MELTSYNILYGLIDPQGKYFRGEKSLKLFRKSQILFIFKSHNHL